MRLAKAAAERGASMSGSPSPGLSLGAPSSQFKLAFSDPPLETAEAIMSSFNSMHRLKALEKACVITAAHRIPSDKLHDLQQRLQLCDKQTEGVVTADKLFDSLHALGVPMADLMQMSKEVADTTATIDYTDYVKTTDEFQRNMQDSVVWAIFRSFDGQGGGEERIQISKQKLVERLKEDDRQKAIREKFPGIGLDSILDKFVADGSGEIDADEFKQILRDGFLDGSRN
jgi:Ca2+-binding EF-hand superfamily protein